MTTAEAKSSRTTADVSVGLLGGALLTVGIAALVWIDATEGTLRAATIPTTVVWFLVAAVGYLVLLVLQRGGEDDHVPWKLFLGLGLVLRLVLLATEPTLSDDIYRYIWEGNLFAQGVSPWGFPIDSPQGDPFEIPARGLANNTTLASPYLPVAQIVFALTTFISLEPIVLQIVMVGFDVLAVTFMIRLLSALGLPKKRSLIYWLNPLVIVEIAHGAHLDAIIVGLTMLALWFMFDLAKRNPWTTYVGVTIFAAATLSRPLVALFVPILFWLWNWRQRILYGLLTVVPVSIVGIVSGFGLEEGATSGAFGSAITFGRTFRFNSGIFAWLARWIARRPEIFDRGYEESFDLARVILVPIVGAALLAVFLRARRTGSSLQTIRAFAVPMTVYVLFTTVLHPWYILLGVMLLPFLAPAAGESRARWVQLAPWVVLSTLLIFSYLTFQDEAAHAERVWVRQLIWIPTLALFAIAGLTSRFGPSRVPQEGKQVRNRPSVAESR